MSDVQEDTYPPRILTARIPWASLDPRSVMWVPCNLCGSGAYQSIASLVINRVEFFLVRCSSCGLQWRNPVPGGLFQHELYSEPYYNVASHAPELVYQVGIPDILESDQVSRTRLTRAEVERWEQKGISAVSSDGPKKLLEIGGGRGYLQRAASAVGWQTVGLEISPHCVKAAISRGLSVLPISLDEFCDRYVPYEGYFDAVVFFDFLEHVADPGMVLRTVGSVLNGEGVVILRVPVTSGPPVLHLIDHIWHWSIPVLRALLSKEGFEIIDQNDSGQFRSPEGSTLDNLTVFARKRP